MATLTEDYHSFDSLCCIAAITGILSSLQMNCANCANQSIPSSDGHVRLPPHIFPRSATLLARAFKWPRRHHHLRAQSPHCHRTSCCRASQRGPDKLHSREVHARGTSDRRRGYLLIRFTRLAVARFQPSCRLYSLSWHTRSGLVRPTSFSPAAQAHKRACDYSDFGYPCARTERPYVVPLTFHIPPCHHTCCGGPGRFFLRLKAFTTFINLTLVGGFDLYGYAI